MTKAEILRYIDTGRSRSVCVDIRLMPELPGFVRSVSLRSGNTVAVEFDTYGADEGGVYFYGKYPSIEPAIVAVEKYLGESVESWKNYTKTGWYPSKPDAVDFTEGHEKMIIALTSARLALPEGSSFQLQEGYWKQATQ